MGPPITVTVIGRIRPERRQHLLAALPRFAATARRQPGCLAFDYRLAQQALTVTEHWEDPLLAMQHLARDRTRHFLAFTHDCLEEPPGLTVTSLPG
jgi:quinol monooxygenase YgiN